MNMLTTHRQSFELCDPSVITHISNGRILVGHEKGNISLWQFSRQQKLKHIQSFCSQRGKIFFVLPISGDKFISVHARCEMEVWEISSGICCMTLHRGSVERIDSAVVLPNNLLVLSGFLSRKPTWECFDVWDLETGECIYKEMQCCHKPQGMPLAITAQGFLVACGYCYGGVFVWKIDRSDCKIISKAETERIYSMAMLPTGEIVIGNRDRNLDFYKISYAGDIYKYRTFENQSVFYTIYPVCGNKFLVIDEPNFERSKTWNLYTPFMKRDLKGNLKHTTLFSRNVKLWDCLSKDCKQLDYFIPCDQPNRCTVLQQECTILSIGKNKINVFELPEESFHLSRHVFEIRKNARILSQAYRTATSFFSNLPKEITMKIISLASISKNIVGCEKIFLEDVAENYFCKPLAMVING